MWWCTVVFSHVLCVLKYLERGFRFRKQDKVTQSALASMTVAALAKSCILTKTPGHIGHRVLVNLPLNYGCLQCILEIVQGFHVILLDEFLTFRNIQRPFKKSTESLTMVLLRTWRTFFGNDGDLRADDWAFDLWPWPYVIHVSSYIMNLFKRSQLVSAYGSKSVAGAIRIDFFSGVKNVSQIWQQLVSSSNL